MSQNYKIAQFERDVGTSQVQCPLSAEIRQGFFGLCVVGSRKPTRWRLHNSGECVLLPDNSHGEKAFPI